MVESQGIGWLVQTPVATAHAARPGQEIHLWLHHHLSMDPNRGGEALYGFSEPSDRELFRLLLAVKGIGPRQALVIISGCGSDALVGAIQRGEDGLLKKIKGVGAKTAQRVVLELKDKVEGLSTATITPEGEPDTLSDTVAALVALGYREAESRKAAEAALKEFPDDEVADLVKLALSRI